MLSRSLTWGRAEQAGTGTAKTTDEAGKTAAAPANHGKVEGG